MRAALLNLARAERDTWGFVTADTRSRLSEHDINATFLEQYLLVTNTGG